MGHNIFVQNIPTTQFLIYQHIYLGIADNFNRLQNHAAVKSCKLSVFRAYCMENWGQANGRLYYR